MDAAVLLAMALAAAPAEPQYGLSCKTTETMTISDLPAEGGAEPSTMEVSVDTARGQWIYAGEKEPVVHSVVSATPGMLVLSDIKDEQAGEIFLDRNDLRFDL